MNSVVRIVASLMTVLGLSACGGESSTPTPDGIRAAIEKIAVADDDTDTTLILEDVSQNADKILSDGDPGALERHKDRLDEKQAEMEKAVDELRSELGDDASTVRVLADCLATTRSVRAARTKEEVPDWEECTQNIVEQEQRLDGEIQAINQDIAQLDEEIASKRKEILEEEDPQKRQVLIDQVKEKEKERDEKRKDRDRKQREKRELQQMRMLLGLALVVLGAYLGGVDGGLLIGAGLNMMTASTNSGGGGENGGDSTTSTDHGDGDSEPQTPTSDNTSSPPVVTEYNQHPDYEVIPVDEASNTAIDGYFLLRQSDGDYRLLHSEESRFWRLVSTAEVTPFGTGDIVPPGFVVSRLVSVEFSEPGRLAEIGVEIDGVEGTRYILEQPDATGKRNWLISRGKIQD